MKTTIDGITIVTNNHRIPLVHIYEMDPKTQEFIKREFDYAFDNLEDPYDCENEFFFFRGSWYDLGEFMRFDYGGSFMPSWAKGYQAYSNDSFFSGIMIRFSNDEYGYNDNEYIQAATFYS
jgi:hypothetical protein